MSYFCNVCGQCHVDAMASEESDGTSDIRGNFTVSSKESDRTLFVESKTQSEPELQPIEEMLYQLDTPPDDP